MDLNFAAKVLTEAEKAGTDMSKIQESLKTMSADEQEQLINEAAKLYGLSETKELPEVESENKKFESDEESQFKFLPEKAKALVSGVASGATLGIVEKIPVVGEKIQELKKAEPDAFMMGDLISYAIPYGAPAKVFQGVRSAQKLITSEKFLAKTLKIGLDAAGQAFVEGVKEGIRSENVESGIKAATVGAEVSAGLGALGTIGSKIYKTIRPKGAHLLSNLDDVTRIKKEGMDKVIFDTAEQMKSKLQEVQKNLAEPGRDAASELQAQIMDEMEKVVGKIDGAVQKKALVARQELTNAATELFDIAEGGRIIANQKFGAALDPIIKSYGKTKLDLTDIQPELRKLFVDSGLAMPAEKGLVANPSHFAFDTVGDLVNSLAGKLQNKKLSIEEVIAIKQNLQKLTSFGKKTTSTNEPMRKLYLMLGDKLKKVVPGYEDLMNSHIANLGIIDDISSGIGRTPNTLANKLEALAGSGNRKDLFFQGALEDFGRMDKRAQEATRKGFETATNVVDTAILKESSIRGIQNDARTYLENTNLDTKAKVNKIMSALSRLDLSADAQRLLQNDYLLPNINPSIFKNENSSELLKLTNYINKYVPHAKGTFEKFKLSCNNVKKAESLLGNLSTENLQKLMRSELPEAEKRAFKYLTQIYPDSGLQNLLDESYTANILKNRSSLRGLGEVESMYNIPGRFVMWALNSPENLIIALNSTKPGRTSTKLIHQSFRKIVSAVAAQNAKED